MAIRIVRLGTPRAPDEGLRLGTVRRPPRGVPKAQLAARDFYDVWVPEAAPSEALLKAARQSIDDAAKWKTFVRRYRAEMKRPESGRLLDLLAALSHRTDLSVGCYCENEARCHRSILRALLEERGAILILGTYKSPLSPLVSHRPMDHTPPVRFLTVSRTRHGNVASDYKMGSAVFTIV